MGIQEKEKRSGRENMKKVQVIVIGAILWMGLLFQVESLAGMLDSSENVAIDQEFDRMRRFALQDAVYGVEESFGYVETPEYEPLEIHQSDVSGFDYKAVSPYYTVYFEGTRTKMSVGDAWVEFELVGQKEAVNVNAACVPDKNLLSVSNVFESVDISYEVDTSLLQEEVILKEPKEFQRIIQKILWEGIDPEFEADGSILFSDDGTKILRVLPPYMVDAYGSSCKDLHYELLETESGYELHKGGRLKIQVFFSLKPEFTFIRDEIL